jgi:hypothetical protein
MPGSSPSSSAPRPVALRWIRAAVLLAGGLAIGLGSARLSLALATDSAPATAAVTTDTLLPPTGLSATGGLTASLAWTATTKTWATGYHIYRATASAGPYSLVGSVTPRTTLSYADSPSGGTYYYKVRAYFQSWESVDAGPASAVVQAQTGYKPCVGASNAADTTGAGDNNGYQTSPARACVDDSLFANDGSSGSGGSQSCGTGAVPDATKDRHQFWGYALGLPASVTSIDGIQLRADLALNNATGTTNLCAQLSWDGGTTWTSHKSQAIAAAAETTYVFGSAADGWGRTWTVGQLNTTNFRVRIIDASTLTSKQFQLDYLAVQVTYTP